MGIQIWFHICNWRILVFKNHLHSRLTGINPKTIRIWSKWAKECLNFTRAREPTYISQMGIRKLFYIFKPIIPLLQNSLRSRLVKLGPILTKSWEKRGPRTTRLLPQSGTRVQLSKLFYIFKPIFPLFLNSLHSGMVKLGSRMTQSWETGAQELHVFAHN
jgi:hypothetical protein